MKEAETLETEDMNWMNEYEGVGQDTLDSNVRAVPFLSLNQPSSEAVSEESPEGTWRNSTSGKNFGPMVRVVALAFHTVWAEREEGTGKTLARYSPNSIEVEVKQPKPGKKGFPKMYSVQTGNEIQEQYIYAIILPDHPEEGVMYYCPAPTSMKTCRSWNSMLFSQLLPNGAQAPIFAYSWNLCAEMVPNPQQPNQQMAKLTKAVRDVLTSKELFAQSIKPQLSTINQSTLLIADSVEPEASDN